MNDWTDVTAVAADEDATSCSESDCEAGVASV